MSDRSGFSLLQPGTAVIIRGDENPQINLLTETVFLDFYFARDIQSLMQTVEPRFGEQNIRVIPPSALEEMIRLGEEIRSERQQCKPGYQLAVLEKILAAERLLCRNGRPRTAQEMRLAAVLQFMSENYSRDITLADLTDLAGASISHFRRNFRRILGIAPIEFLLNLRLLQAEKRLLETDLTIAEIAAGTGFNDANYFSRIFTRRKGCPPHKWRQTARKS